MPPVALRSGSTYQLAPLRSHADFGIVRPLRSRVRGRVGGLRGRMTETEGGLHLWIRGDTGAISYADGTRGICHVDSDAWPWVEIDVTADPIRRGEYFSAGRAGLALNGGRVGIDVRVHDLGMAPPGGAETERRLFAIAAAVPRRALLALLKDAVTGLPWQRITGLDLDLYLEWTGVDGPQAVGDAYGEG